MLINDKNIDILLETFFEVYFLCRFTEKEVFDSEHEEMEYVLLDNTLTNYMYILDILGFEIEESENNVKVIFNGDLIKETRKD